MLIDGKYIAQNILKNLKIQTEQLKTSGIIPTLAVILIGYDPGSLSYIRQKEKACEAIGATLSLTHKSGVTSNELNKLIRAANTNRSIHGIIVQRPLPGELGDATKLLKNIVKYKDIDGFDINSPFDPPVALAVIEILKECYKCIINEKGLMDNDFSKWLCDRKIAIIGRGETAGKPINKYLLKLNCATTVINSQTVNPAEIVKKMDIIISCVGKERTVRRNMIKLDSIVISVGLWRDSSGKLGGDYDEDEIKDFAGFYTPTPGGVGPVNVACLMTNLIMAAKKTQLNRI